MAPPAERVPTLESRLHHPSFPQPPDADVNVWRYMDLAKLLWSLKKRRLYLCRLDLLGDPLEGSLPRRNAEGYRSWLRERGLGGEEQNVETAIRKNLGATYVSCWRLGQHESEAMWRIYCPSGIGVALRTTYRRLVRWIEPHPVYIGMVKYIDFDTGAYASRALIAFDWAMHKRIAFEHEREVRMVAERPAHMHAEASAGQPGIEFPWEPDASVDVIHVSPYAQEYYADAVRAAVGCLAPELAETTCWSSMRVAPRY